MVFTCVCVVSIVKFSGASVMVWGPLVLVNDNVNSEGYVNIFDNSMLPYCGNSSKFALFFISTKMLLFIKQRSLHRGLKTNGWM